VRELRNNNFALVLTPDHGTTKVNNPIKVVGERSTNTNLRYKLGRNLNYNSREVYEVKRPDQARLPTVNVSTGYIFAMNQDFFAYPNNFNHYANYYKNTFQHGGISLEEILIPCVRMVPRGS
jgi:hypothetical protein